MEIKPKVSVIIPVYNAGHRLRTCIDSLVNQTFKDIELIFVVDCPTDGSDVVVDEYASKYDNIVVIKNDCNLNIGLSRNKGLSVSRGEFVAFCDHDDMLKRDAFELLYNIAISKQVDIILGVPVYTYEDSKLDKAYFYPREGNVKQEILRSVIGESEDLNKWKFYFSHGVIWGKLYRRSFLEDHLIRFVDNRIITFEDNLFLIESLYYSNKIEAINEIVYYHTIEDSNTASSSSYVETEKVLGYIHYLNDFLREKSLYDRYKCEFANSVMRYTIGCISREVKINYFLGIMNILRQLKKDDIVRESFINGSFYLYIKNADDVFRKIYHSFIYLYIKY